MTVDPFSISPILGGPDHAWHDDPPREPDRHAINPDRSCPSADGSVRLGIRVEPNCSVGIDHGSQPAHQRTIADDHGQSNPDRTIRNADDSLNVPFRIQRGAGEAAERRDQDHKIHG